MMNSSNHRQIVAAANYPSEDQFNDWAWGAVGGRWSVAQALTVLAGLSLVIWVLVLVALLT